MVISKLSIGLNVLAFASMVGACADVSGSNGTGVSIQAEATRIGSAVSKKVAATLSVNGEIPVSVDNQPGSEITAARATELGLAYVKTYGLYHRSILEKAVGVPIDFNRLNPEARTFFATSPYEDLDGRYSKPSAKALGPYYLITLSQDGDPVISLAVSAKASDLEIVKGQLKFPDIYGNEFWIIPIRPEVRWPLTPEVAAVIANQATGLIVDEAPLLVIPARSKLVPQYSMWRVVGVRDKSSGGNPGVVSDTVYVTFDRKLLKRSDRIADNVHTLWSSATGHPRLNATLRERVGIASNLEALDMIST